MRGGTSYISEKYSEANNKYCPNYDKNKPKVYINYLNMNNLYGYSISEFYHMEVLNGLKLIIKQLIEY